MTPLSRWPSSDPSLPIENTPPESSGLDSVVQCGPIALGVTAESAGLRQRSLAKLALFTSRWADAPPLVRVHLRATSERAAIGEGRFLRCSDMHVDQASHGLVATCRWGASGVYDASRRHWDLRIVNATRDVHPDSVEGLLELVLTTAWREAGWVPLHAGGVVSGRRCALLVAPAKGGKSTLTAAMLHRGWRALGDDKALIALDAGGQPEVRGLARQFSLDPRTRTWFPEVGDLERLPRLSDWNAKRRVSIEEIWGDCVADRAVPTHVVVIRRCAGKRPMRVEALGASEILSALLHQTVVPSDATTAKAILTVLARSARAMRGVRLEIGDDAYADPRSLDVLDEMLR